MSNGLKEAADFVPSEDRIAFDYVKAHDFHVMRADGAIGGITSNGQIHLAFYSERQSIPRRVVYAVDANGVLGDVIESECLNRGTVVREMTADLFLTVEVAESLCTWLAGQIVRAKALPTKSKIEGED